MPSSDLYKKAKQLLYQEYEQAYEIVKGSPYHKMFADEKIKHSLQVSGAGNGILAHEPYFESKSSDFVEMARVAVLLHDIYRFREIVGMYQNKSGIDHSIKGAEFLADTKDFNNILITMPVKHHGHMIEALYEDQVFQNLDEQTKDAVKHIAFAVRDADKIANWCLLCHEWDNMREVWLPFADDYSVKQGQISSNLWNGFMQMTLLPGRFKTTNADMALSVICWLFDINYTYSIKYCKDLKLFDKWLILLQNLHVDSTQISTIYDVMKQYVDQKFNIKI